MQGPGCSGLTSQTSRPRAAVFAAALLLFRYSFSAQQVQALPVTGDYHF